MSELFDDISRIVADSIPRRQALKLIAGTFAAGATLHGLWPLQGWTTEITTARIIKKLATASTHRKAEIAIRQLLNKIGVGMEGSRYEYYSLSDKSIRKLASMQKRFLNGMTPLTIGLWYESLHRVAEEFIHYPNLEEALNELYEQASVALVDPESPENALLTVLVAQGPTLPTTVPIYDANTIISPVQGFLFHTWLTSSSIMDELCRIPCILERNIGNFLCNTVACIAGPLICFACLRGVEEEFDRCIRPCGPVVDPDPDPMGCCTREDPIFGGCDRVRRSTCEDLLPRGTFVQEPCSCEPTAIDLRSFTAEAQADGTCVLAWETATEVDNAGFNLYRARVRGRSHIKINDTLIPAQGDPVAGASYRFADRPGYGTFRYWLEDVDYYGMNTLHGPVTVRVSEPSFPRRPRR